MITVLIAMKVGRLKNLQRKPQSSDRRNAFRTGSSAAYQAAHKRGLLDQICSHMAPSKTGKKWNKASVTLEASKYLHRSDFENGSSGAYNAALKNGWLNEVCCHMSPKTRGKKSFKRTLEG